MVLKKIFYVVMIMLLLFVGALLVVVLVENLEARDECDALYFKSKGKCCIDVDSNRICDADQFKIELETKENIDEIQSSRMIQELKEENAELKAENEKITIQVEEANRNMDYYYNAKYYYKYAWEEEDYWYYKRYVDYYDLEIIVKDDDTYDRIGDAYVRIQGPEYESGYTDNDGRIEFEDIKEGCYDIKVEADGYDREYANVCIDEDTRKSIYVDE